EGAEPEIKLAPCSSATVRVLDPAGKVLDRPAVMLDLVLRPGDEVNESMQKRTDARITVYGVAPYGKGYAPVPAGGGALTFPALIPGATYMIRVRADNGLGWPGRRIFTVPGPGQRLTLKDITTQGRVAPGAPR